MWTKILHILKMTYQNPAVKYVAFIAVEWLYFLLKKDVKGKDTTVTENKPTIVDANNDGICDHCGQNYTVGMDKDDTETSLDPEEPENRKPVTIVKTKKVDKRNTRKDIESLETPGIIAKPKKKSTRGKFKSRKTSEEKK